MPWPLDLQNSILKSSISPKTPSNKPPKPTLETPKFGEPRKKWNQALHVEILAHQGLHYHILRVERDSIPLRPLTRENSVKGGAARQCLQWKWGLWRARNMGKMMVRSNLQMERGWWRFEGERSKKEWKRAQLGFCWVPAEARWRMEKERRWVFIYVTTPKKRIWNVGLKRPLAISNWMRFQTIWTIKTVSSVEK